MLSAEFVKLTAGPVSNPPSWMHQAMKSHFLKAVLGLFQGKNVKQKRKF